MVTKVRYISHSLYVVYVSGEDSVDARHISRRRDINRIIQSTSERFSHEFSKAYTISRTKIHVEIPTHKSVYISILRE